MRMSLSQVEKIIAKLEKASRPPWDDRFVLSRGLHPEARARFTAGQRIVEDHYENEEGKLVMTQERITDDPSDVGKTIPRQFWGRDALRAYQKGTRDAPSDIRIAWRNDFRPPAVTERQASLSDNAPVGTEAPDKSTGGIGGTSGQGGDEEPKPHKGREHGLHIVKAIDDCNDDPAMLTPDIP